MASPGTFLTVSAGGGGLYDCCVSLKTSSTTFIPLNKLGNSFIQFDKLTVDISFSIQKCRFSKLPLEKTARQFLLLWSCIGTRVIRDMTLHSAPSFGK